MPAGTLRLAPVTNMRETWRTLAVGGDQVAQLRLVGRGDGLLGRARGRRAAEVGQVAPGGGDRVRVVGDPEVDDPDQRDEAAQLSEELERADVLQASL